LSKPEKKPAEAKKVLQSVWFVPKVEGTGAKFPDEYEASRSMEQTIWWAHNSASKLEKIEAHIKEAARMLGCGPASIVEVLKEKIATCNRMEDLQIQKEKDLKRI
jgi:hypothetical protein